MKGIYITISLLFLSTVSYTQNCAAGQYWNGSDCVTCTAGYYCAGGSTYPVLCPSGTYCPAGSSTYSVCPANTYNPNTGATSSADCLACASGTTSQFGATTCYTACPAGQYWNGSSCVVCPFGYYCNAGSTTPIICPGGYYCQEGSSSPLVCNAGFYCPQGSGSGILCPVGNYCEAGSSVPSVCPANTFNPTQGAASSSSCQNCPSNTSSPPGAASCSPSCPAGQYWNGTNCIICPPGFYCPVGNNVPILCPSGYFCSEGSTVPVACPQNTYSPIPGAASSAACLTCAPGSTSGSGSSGCFILNDGFCNSFAGENCSNSPADCACQSSLDCVNGVCVFEVDGNVGVNNINPKSSLDVKGGFSHRGLEVEAIFNSDTVTIPANVSFVTITGYAFGQKVIKFPIENVNGQRLVIANNFTGSLIAPLLNGNVSIEATKRAEFINDGIKWNFLNKSNSDADFWKLNGNSGVQNYQGIGTLDTNELHLKTNGINRMTIKSSGSVDIFNDILTNGTSGEYGQVLTSNGNGTMKWSSPDQQGSIIEVNPFTANVDSFLNNGYVNVGTKSTPVSITTSGGGVVTGINSDESFGRGAHLFYHAATQKIYAVNTNTISSFSLHPANYGEKINYSVPAFNLINRKPVFTGNKILLFPHFSFDCVSNTTSTFIAPPCPSFTTTDQQVWTGNELIVYGPNGGLEFNPSTSTYECFENPAGNIYRAQASVIYTGDRVIFYGGYVAVGLDTFVDNGGFIYFPSSNTYDEITPGPIVRNHLVLWTGSEMLLYGGKSTFDWHNTYQLYNPVTDVWNAAYTPITAPICDRSHSFPLVSNGKVFTSNYLDYFNDGQWKSIAKSYFNISTKTSTNFTLNIGQIEPKYLNNAVVVNNQIHYFPNVLSVPSAPLTHFIFDEPSLKNAPGFATNLITSSSYKLTDGNNYALAFGDIGVGLVFHKSKNTWFKTTATNMPAFRTGHVAVHLGNDKFMIWGGVNGSTYYNTGAIYDAAADTWTTLPSISITARKDAGAAKSGNFVLIYGGVSGSTNFNNGIVYNISANIWLSVSASGSPNGGNLEDKIFGIGSSFYVYSNTLRKYSVSTNSWMNTSFGGPFLPSVTDSIYVVGGITFNGRQHKLNESVSKGIDISFIEYLNYKPLTISQDKFLLMSDANGSIIYNPSTEIFKISTVKVNSSYSSSVNKIALTPPFSLLPGSIYLDPNYGLITDGMPKFQHDIGGSITGTYNLKTTVLRKK